MKKTVATILVCAGAVAMVFATVVACVQVFAFNRDFYKSEYTYYGTASDVGVDSETLTQATEVLLSYIEGGRDTLDMPAQLPDGSVGEYYNQKEKQHMVDVRVLYENARAYMILAYALGTVGIIAGCMLLKDGKRVLRAAFWSMVGTLAAFAVLGVWIVLDFNSFWTVFHQVMFSNELWLLDPATSLLIRMFPGSFFFDLVGNILGLFLIIVCAAIAGTGIAHIVLKKRARAGIPGKKPAVMY